MVNHMLAFVNFKYYRKSDLNKHKFRKSFQYISKKPRVRDFVGRDGTLWVVTSHLVNKQRVYALAFKLTNCEPWEPDEQFRKDFGEYGVIGDLGKSVHYPINEDNDIGAVLTDLCFAPEKPIRDSSVIGVSLLTPRCLTPVDVQKLESFADKLLHGKHIFISYSSKDHLQCDALEAALKARGHKRIWRDIRSIAPGEQWEKAIEQAVERADVFVVLVSTNSAASEWVQRELETALRLYRQPGKLKCLLPVVLSPEAWSDFPIERIHEFQKRDWNGYPSDSVINGIADELYRLNLSA